jgi:hypothetical protein
MNVEGNLINILIYFCQSIGPYIIATGLSSVE